MNIRLPVLLLGLAVGSILYAQTPPAPTPAPAPATPPATGPAPASLFAPSTAPAAASRPALLPTGTPTLEEFARLLEEQKSKDVLLQLNRIFDSPRLAAPYERPDLLIIKAEALLQSKDTMDAVQAFAQVVKEGADPDRLAYAFASEMIIRRTPGFMYAPKSAVAIKAATGPDNKAITYDVRLPKQRRLAFRLLFLDEVEAAKTIVQAAMKADSLPPMAKAVQPLADLQILERAYSGDEVQIRQAKQELLDRVFNVVSESLQRMAADTEVIRARANELLDNTISQIDPRTGAYLGAYVVTTRRGLDANQTADLKATLQTCAQLDPNLKEFSKRLDPDAKTPKLQPLITQNENLARHVKDILTDDYSMTRGGR